MPTSVSETKIVTISAIDIETLRRRPVPVSEKTYLSCMGLGSVCSLVRAGSRRRRGTGRGRRGPSASSMTRLRIWSTMPASWVAMTTVVPVRLIRSSSFMIPTLVLGSRLPVGSSAIRIFGRLTNARAIATRCCSPPESSSGIRWPLPSRPTSSSVSGTTLLMWARGLPITWSAKATFSETVLFGSSRKSWKTVPIWRRSAGHLPAAEPVEILARHEHLALGRPRLPQHEPQERSTCRSRTDRRGRRTRPRRCRPSRPPMPAWCGRGRSRRRFRT